MCTYYIVEIFITVSLIVIHKLISVANSGRNSSRILLKSAKFCKILTREADTNSMNQIPTSAISYIFEFFKLFCPRLIFYSSRIPFEQAGGFIYWPYLTVSIGQKNFNHSQEKLWDRNHLQTWSLSWLIWLKKLAWTGNHWRRCMKTSLQKKELTRKNLLAHTENLIQSK